MTARPLAQGIVNRDVKLENTLLSGDLPPLVKIGDWGFSSSASRQGPPSSRVGTLAYLAPEVVRCRKGGGGAPIDGAAADLWSAGVLLYVMLTATYPFERAGDREDPRCVRLTLDRIQKADYPPPAGVRPRSLTAPPAACRAHPIPPTA